MKPKGGHPKARDAPALAAVAGAPGWGDHDPQVAALIATLHETGKRLEELTGGEVDSVVAPDGRAFLLQHAQDQLRDAGAAKQAGILDALPASIALLDPRGTILAVNEAWRRFSIANQALLPGHGVGTSYLTVCDLARGEDSPEASRVAAGIRKVLSGAAPGFSMEYSCHSPTEQRWFLMTVSPMAGTPPSGAVVMHVNITERKLAEEEMLRFVAAMDSVADAIYVTDRSTMLYLHVNEAACRIQGLTREQMLMLGPADMLPTPRHELERIYDAIIESGEDAAPLEEYRDRGNGAMVWVEVRRNARRMGKGWMINTLVRDITDRRRASEELQRSESLKTAILEASPDCLVTVDHDGRIVEFNPAAESTFGYTRAEALGRDMTELIVPARYREAHHKGFARYLATGEGPNLGKRRELSAIRKDGSEFPAEFAINAIRTSGRPLFTGYLRDITARRETDQKLKRLNRVYAVLSGINSLIVRVGDRDQLFLEACRIAVEQGGFRMAWIAILDKASGILKPIASAGDVRDFFDSAFLATAHNQPGGPGLPGCAVREKKPMIANDVRDDPRILGKKKLEERGILSAAIIPLVVAGEGFGVLALYAADANFFDDEEIRLLEELGDDIAFAIDHLGKQERLDYLAYYDALTGLPNLRLLLGRVGHGMRRASARGDKLALLVIDLERFKDINDTLGRSAGDALLTQVAQWLKRVVGDAELVAHLGADRFAVVLPAVTREGAVGRLLEKKIRAFLDHQFQLNDGMFRIAAKVGVAIFPRDGANADSLFKHAEAALKKAKASGNRWLSYAPAMTERVAGNLTLENQLRQALDKEEFVLHYQPKVNLASGKLTGVEALIRWNDPRTGLVPPGRFIPVLEETGLIHDVGRWALKQAIADYLRWRAAGLPAVRVAVNVSPLQLRSRLFVAEVGRAIGVDADARGGLELEITESLIMEDIKHSIAVIQAVRALGVTVAIDDFGTGFSSLSYLAKLPVDTLKIDRSFVVDMTVGPEGLALVSTIINLAHSLNLKVIAEGVETDEQSRLLRLLDCDEMQGFLFSRPVPADTFEARFLAAPRAA